MRFSILGVLLRDPISSIVSSCKKHGDQNKLEWGGMGRMGALGDMENGGMGGWGSWEMRVLEQ